jgi:acetyl-CoA carboxylase/biotin carboxylase 1
VREQPDGSLLATIAGRTRKLFGQEEPLGIRVSIDGTTVFIPSVSDPTELRTDVTGKVVRYLQPDGAAVKKGTPYVEVEAMKMIMPLKVGVCVLFSRACLPSACWEGSGRSVHAVAPPSCRPCGQPG